ncbi:ABC transporter substrate-binding protein [Gordonia rubripertincta]|uniref:ABC transporter substrate-binding protein n=1 Tax=Gordonia rubripertincta TaxID=36822 RepID=A0AAW4G7Y0_GORRU|nr:ABC transporter substrate-binding protein [Gordonia rubripertincta]MBM7279364.1 ABC transporter substrate-binding protein [Gordonia rubripertincta]
MNIDLRTPIRRVKRTVAVLAAASAVMALAACGSDDTSSSQRDVIDTLRIGVIGSSNVIAGPVGFAHSRGELIEAFAPLGVSKVEVFSFPNGPDLNQALIGGRLDVASYGDTPALVARGSGLQTRLVAVQQFDNDAGVVAKDPSIKTLKDLAGKNIGVPKGSYIDRYLQGALAEEGISANLIHLYPADQEAPLNSGEIDGAALPGVIPSVQLQAFEAKGFHLVDSVYRDHPNLAGTSVTVSSEDFLTKNPEFAPTWQKLHAAAVRYAKAHWDEYLKFELANSKAPEAAVRAAANPDGYSEEPFPAQAVELLTGTKAFLVEQGSIKADFDLDTWFQLPSGDKNP